MLTVQFEGEDYYKDQRIETEEDLRRVFGTGATIRRRTVYTIEHPFDRTRPFIAMSEEEIVS